MSVSIAGWSDYDIDYYLILLDVERGQERSSSKLAVEDYAKKLLVMVCLVPDLPVLTIANVSPQALRLAAAKLPFRTEFITPAALPRLGNLLVPRPSLITESSSSMATSEEASAQQQQP
jgi:hypothetical protein